MESRVPSEARSLSPSSFLHVSLKHSTTDAFIDAKASVRLINMATLNTKNVHTGKPMESSSCHNAVGRMKRHCKFNYKKKKRQVEALVIKGAAFLFILCRPHIKHLRQEHTRKHTHAPTHMHATTPKHARKDTQTCTHALSHASAQKHARTQVVKVICRA